MESLDDIINELNYHEMWYKWITTKSPNNREIVALDSMPKQKQFLFLQKKVGK